eukprot:14554688-Alexandrium_andersonii.AAC.1
MRPDLGTDLRPHLRPFPGAAIAQPRKQRLDTAGQTAPYLDPTARLRQCLSRRRHLGQHR